MAYGNPIGVTIKIMPITQRIANIRDTPIGLLYIGTVGTRKPLKSSPIPIPKILIRNSALLVTPFRPAKGMNVAKAIIVQVE